MPIIRVFALDRLADQEGDKPLTGSRSPLLVTVLWPLCSSNGKRG